MALRNMQHDCTYLEQREIAFFIGWDLAEGMKRQMCGLLHRPDRNKANLVRLAHFVECPANAGIPRQSLATIRDRSKAVMVMVIVRLLPGQNRRLR
jgi:hypothetical protein